jgi:hypothetical protein
VDRNDHCNAIFTGATIVYGQALYIDVNQAMGAARDLIFIKP